MDHVKNLTEEQHLICFPVDIESSSTASGLPKASEKIYLILFDTSEKAGQQSVMKATVG